MIGQPSNSNYGVLTFLNFACFRIKKVESGEDYPDVLEKIKFSSVAWTHDNKVSNENNSSFLYPTKDLLNIGLQNACLPLILIYNIYNYA